MRVKRKHFSDSAEEIGAGLAAGGLGAGVGYLGYRAAKNAGETGRVIGDRLSWKKVGDKQLESRGDRTRELGIKVKKAGKKISDFAKTKGGRTALIATPAVIAGGTTYISKRRKRKKSEENN